MCWTWCCKGNVALEGSHVFSEGKWPRSGSVCVCVLRDLHGTHMQLSSCTWTWVDTYTHFNFSRPQWALRSDWEMQMETSQSHLGMRDDGKRTFSTVNCKAQNNVLLSRGPVSPNCTWWFIYTHSHSADSAKEKKNTKQKIALDLTHGVLETSFLPVRQCCLKPPAKVSAHGYWIGLSVGTNNYFVSVFCSSLLSLTSLCASQRVSSDSDWEQRFSNLLFTLIVLKYHTTAWSATSTCVNNAKKCWLKCFLHDGASDANTCKDKLDLGKA